MRKILLTLCLLTSVGQAWSNAFKPSEKIYINSEDLDSSKDSFHIHTGHNSWIETDTVHKDNTGLYMFESSIRQSIRNNKAQYKKTWKCPYCYQYFEVGQACDNADCPSRYPKK